MTRGHRAFHRMLWPALALIVALGFTMALVLRPPPEAAAGASGAAQMSVGFQAVQWNRRKLVYDGILIAGVVLFIGTFMTVGALRNPPADMPAWINLRIKAFGTCAFMMLTIILMIGPLARLDRRFLPLLYNRRHFGVLTFLVALVHACSVVDWFAVQGAMGDLIGRNDRQPELRQVHRLPDQGARPHRPHASCSCSPPPATTSGSRSSRRASGRRCTWRSTSPTACW